MRLLPLLRLGLAVVGLGYTLSARSAPPDEARAAAKKYLDALVGTDASGRELTFGGLTTGVQLATLENYSIKGDAVKEESAPLADLQAAIARLDEAGKAAEDKLMAAVGAADTSKGGELVEIGAADVAAINEATQREQAAVKKRFPAFAKIARVDKGLYWNAKNPARKLLQSAGKDGKYQLTLHTFDVETKEGPREEPRTFHLKVFRFRAGPVDTGFVILAAADFGVD